MARLFQKCFPSDVMLSHSCLRVEHTLSATVSLALIGTGALGINSAVRALAHADETHNASHRHMAVQMWLLSAYLIVLSLLSLLGAVRRPKRLLYMFNCLQSFFFRGALHICIGSSVVILALQGGVGIPSEVFVPQACGPVTASPAAADDGTTALVVGAVVEAVVTTAACGYARVDTSVGTEYIRYWCLGVGGASVVMGLVVCVLGCPCFALPGPRSLEDGDAFADADHIAFGAVDSGTGLTGADTERSNLLSRRMGLGYQSGSSAAEDFPRAASIVAAAAQRTGGPATGSLRTGAGASVRRPPAGVGTPSGVSGAVDVVDPVDSADLTGLTGTQLLVRSPPSQLPGAVTDSPPVAGATAPAGATAGGVAPLARLPSSAHQPPATVRATTAGSVTDSGSERASPVDGGSRYGTPLAHAPPPQRTPSALPGAGLGAAATATPGSNTRRPPPSGRPLPSHLQPDEAPVANPFGDADAML